MRGRDDETGEFLGPSRSEQRRAALDVLALAGQLADLSPVQLARLPVPEALLPQIAEALSKGGYKDADVTAILGGNFLRVAEATWTTA